MKPRRILFITVGLLAAVYTALTILAYMHRPIFCNQFGFFQESPLPFVPGWVPVRSEVRDPSGNRFLADFHQNFFLAVQASDPHGRPKIQGGGKRGTALLSDGREISFPIKPDTIVRIFSDGTIRQSQLLAHDAERLFIEIKGSALPDRGTLLDREIGSAPETRE